MKTVDINELFQILEQCLNALDSWGSPTDVFTAIGGFLTGLCAGPVGLIISRFIDRKKGKETCSLTGACLKKENNKKDSKTKDKNKEAQTNV